MSEEFETRDIKQAERWMAGERLSEHIAYLESQVRDLTGKRDTLVTAVKSLLEWMPICSVGSTGHSRRVAVEKALEAL